MADPRSTVVGLSPAHVEVRYGDALLVPAPLIAFQQQIERDDAGVRERIVETRTLTGVILVASGGYHNVKSKQDELESAFSQDNLELTIRAGEGNPCIASGTYITSGIFPRVESIEIREDIQYNRLDYTIVLENEVTVSGLSGVVSDFSNTWSYTENSDDCTIEISHTISAQGVNTAVSGQPSNALYNAKLRVQQFLGLATAPSGFPFYAQPVSGSDVGFWELRTTRSETIGLADGDISITEEFILTSGVQPYVDSRTAQFQIDENGIVTIVLNGTVQGFGRTNDGAAEAAGRSSGGTGFTFALSGFNNNIRPNFFSDAATIYSRYQGSGTLADNVQGLTITQNPCNATIAYSVTYTDDPAENLPSGIQERTATVQITDPVVEVANHTVPFRALGAIFQRICTTSPGSYQVSVTVQATNTGDRVVDTNRAIEYAETELNRLAPNFADYIDIYVSARSRSVDDVNRSITASYTWTFAQDISTIPGDEATISLERIS